MTRPVYEIRINGDFICKKFAWNSATREIPKIISTMLNTGETARLVDRELDRPDKHTFKGGVFNWLSNTGKTFKAEITLTKEAT